MRRPRSKNFDLNLLRIFDAVFQHGTVNAAANEIGVSPSAISHALGRLRHMFDDELFVKGAGGMVPTARAAEIADGVAAALRQVEAVFEPLQARPDMADRHFRLRCNQYVAWLVLPHIVKEFREQHLPVNMALQNDDTKGVADDLDTAAIDLVLSSFGNIPERFESEVLFEDYWTWALRKDHPALAGEVSVDRLLELPHLVLATAEAGRSIDGLISEAGLERGVVADRIFLSDERKSRYSTQVRGALVTNDIMLMPSILGQSDLVAMLPARLAELTAERCNITIFAPPPEERRVIEHRMVWHRKHGSDPALVWLRTAIRNSVQSWVNRQGLFSSANGSASASLPRG